MKKLLSSEEKSNIVDKLNALIPAEEFCICYKPDVNIFDELIALPIAGDSGFSGKGMLSVATKCSNCGRIEFFSASNFSLKL